MTRRLTGSAALLELLADEGVEYLFGNPGTTELPLMAELPTCSAITYVLGTQESAVVAMADGYARATGRLAVCNVHVAPGLGNAMGSLFNAHWIGSPLIVTAGQHEQGHGVMEPMLYGPLQSMARPVVKWATEVTRLADLPRVMRRAAKIALAPPTGPVFISLPGDVLTHEEDVDLLRSHRVDARNRPSDRALQALAERLLAADRPVLVCGHEVNTRRALDQAGDLADLLGAAVFQDTVLTAAPFVSSHDCYLGTLSRDQEEVAARLADYDLLVCLGTDVLRMSLPGVSPLPAGLPVVQIAERGSELAKNYPTEVAIQADVRETLIALTVVLRDRQSPAQAEAAARRRDAIRPGNWSAERARLAASLETQVNRPPIRPDVLMLCIVDALPPDAVVVDEGLTSSVALPRLLPYRDAWSYYGLASGGIGFAAGGAIGIRLAIPDRPLVAIIGDGSALYNIQALWTAAHLRLPMVYVIANNGGYRILKQRLRASYGVDKYVGMDLSDPPIDFAALAASMGVRSRRLSALGEVAPPLKEALAYRGPTLLDVILEGEP